MMLKVYDATNERKKSDLVASKTLANIRTYGQCILAQIVRDFALNISTKAAYDRVPLMLSSQLNSEGIWTLELVMSLNTCM
jgi:hypothetical protein